MTINTYADYITALWAKATIRDKYALELNTEFYNRLILETEFIDQPCLRQRVWHVLNGIYTVPSCPVCCRALSWHTDKKVYRQFCSPKCRALGTVEQAKHISILRYGASHYSKTNEYKNRVLETSIQKFGKDHYSKTDKFKTAYKETSISKYGVEHVMQLDSVKKSIKTTSLEKYGTASPLSSPTVRDKITKTCIERFGNPVPSKTAVVKAKSKLTSLSRYNTEHFSRTSDYKERYKETCNKKYGTDYASQSHISRENLEKSRNKDWLIHQHHVLMLPVYKIADDLGMSGSHMCHIFAELDIEIRHFFRSTGEKEVYEFIRDLIPGLEILTNNRKVIAPLELDIYIPSLGLAVEFCGVFYHSEPIVGKHYHLEKYKRCKAEGIKLVQIFENEWLTKQHIVKNILRNYINQSLKIYARKCIIKEVSNIEAKKFFVENHIQGYKTSSTRLGLFYNNELVSCMTFNKSKHKIYDYELVRFANKIGYTVVGGASKLFKEAISRLSPTRIVSYCDCRYFSGSLYELLKFKYSHSSSPNYFYFYQGKTDKLFSREQFQKHTLQKKLSSFDNSLTEWENMKNNKYNRIWDCGNKVFVWVKT